MQGPKSVEAMFSLLPGIPSAYHFIQGRFLPQVRVQVFCNITLPAFLKILGQLCVFAVMV